MSNNRKWEFCMNLPIVDVCRDIGGVHWNGKCKSTTSPFRASNSKTAFTIDVKRNIFADWGYPTSDNRRGIVCGDPIDFVKYLYDCTSHEAVEFLWNRYHGGTVNEYQAKRKDVEKDKSKEAPDLSKEKLDLAYSVFLSLSTLNDETRAYLHGRNLTDDDITYYAFRTFPKRTIKTALNETLRGLGIRPESVPGLYIRANDKDASFRYYNALVLPVRTVDGYIEGLQLRFFEPGEGPKYIWFSSSNCTSPECVYDGKKPGTPIGFVDAHIRTASTLFITEGMFKAIAINKCYGCPVLSVQGVGNFAGIETIVQKAIDKYPGIKRILIAYDADFISNVNVTAQAVRLFKTLETFHPHLKYQYVSWDEKYGKGFDDLINNTGGWDVKNIVKTIDMQKFSDISEEILPEARQLWMEGKRSEIATLFKGKLFENN